MRQERPLTTVMDVVRLSTKHLAERGADSPRLDAELLAAHSLGLRRLDLYLQFDRPLDETEGIALSYAASLSAFNCSA